MLLGCYRPGDANDPEIYAAGIVEILRSYPEDVVRRVTAPRTGLPGRLKWLPTIAEVREACEAEVAPQRREAARKRSDEEVRRFLANPESYRPWRVDGERAALPPAGAAEPAPRKTYDELVAECARRGGLVPRQKGTRHTTTQEECERAEKELALLAERARQPSGIKASAELLAKLEEGR